jgi:hypothetical protein
VIEHITRQLAAAYNGIRRQPRGEHVRMFAAQTRTLAVYGRQNGLDDRLRSALSTLIDRDGRSAVLYDEVDRNRLRADLKAYGAVPDERLLGLQVMLDYTARNAALNGLLQTGLSVRLERISNALDRRAPAVDERSGTIVRVAQQPTYDEEYWKGYCAELWNQYTETQFLAVPICASAALPIIGVVFAPVCAAYQLAAMFLAIVYAGYCMNAR